MGTETESANVEEQIKKLQEKKRQIDYEIDALAKNCPHTESVPLDSDCFCLVCGEVI